MGEARWFLAHSKQDEDADIDFWCKRLGELMSQDGWTTRVIPGRDDYETRAKAMGGWSSWCRDVPQAEDYSGAPMFHGIVVPADALEDTPTVGRATAQLVEGFLARDKHVFTWCPRCEEFRQVTALEKGSGDSWKAWSTLLFDDQEEKESGRG